jgi:alpha-L-fucosidase
MFVHFAPNTWQDKEYDDRTTPLSAITPDIDTDQWAETAVALGARYIVLVAKHVGGFCLWQTETTDYSIKGTPWKGGRGDVCADLAASCARRGLGMGVYLSPRDDSFGAATSGRCATPEAQARYDALYRRQLTELLTRNGPIVELWVDGSSVVPTGDIVARYAPEAMVFQGPQATIRWVGNEDGFAPYPAWNALALADARSGVATAMHSDRDGDAWMPIEVDVSIRRPNWFWSTTNERNLVSLDALLEIWYRSVGRGCQLLLNLPPDRSGRIPAADAARAREFGDEIRRRFAAPAGETAGTGPVHTVRFGSPRRVDHVVLQEDLALGERVREYRLEGQSEGRWGLLDTGSAIGHKRVHPVTPAPLDAIRLTCTRAAGVPHIRRFAAHETGATPPATWQGSTTLWADDEVGRWSGESFELDLTDKIPAAAQYRVRFVGADGPARLRNAEAVFGGVVQPQALRADRTRSDVAILTVHGLGQRIVLRGRISGARQGTVLLRRL